MTAKEVNALPERVRNYIHDLESFADPAGLVQRNWALEEQNEYLQKRLLLNEQGMEY